MLQTALRLGRIKRQWSGVVSHTILVDKGDELVPDLASQATGRGMRPQERSGCNGDGGGKKNTKSNPSQHARQKANSPEKTRTIMPIEKMQSQAMACSLRCTEYSSAGVMHACA
jgi:hypothetical protein